MIYSIHSQCHVLNLAIAVCFSRCEPGRHPPDPSLITRHAISTYLRRLTASPPQSATVRLFSIFQARHKYVACLRDRFPVACKELAYSAWCAQLSDEVFSKEAWGVSLTCYAMFIFQNGVNFLLFFPHVRFSQHDSQRFLLLAFI